MFSSVSSRSAYGGASAYRQAGVEAKVAQANPHELIGLLFEALLLAVGSARAALQRGDIPAKGRQIGIAVRILQEGLQGGLDLERGGKLAGNLYELYAYCVVRLTQANLRNDDDAMAEVLRLIEPLASGWKEIGVVKMPQLKAA